jgi:uncharacterized metal-binding protein YceD (DUF177 family)
MVNLGKDNKSITGKIFSLKSKNQKEKILNNLIVQSMESSKNYSTTEPKKDKDDEVDPRWAALKNLN